MERLLDIDNKTRSLSAEKRMEAYALLCEYARDARDAGVRGSAVLRAVDCFCAPCTGLEGSLAGDATRHALRAALLEAAVVLLHAHGRVDRAHTDEAIARIAPLLDDDPCTAPPVLCMLTCLIPVLTLSPSSEAILVYVASRHLGSANDAVFGAAVGLCAAIGPHERLTAAALQSLSNPVRKAAAFAILPPFLRSRLPSS